MATLPGSDDNQARKTSRARLRRREKVQRVADDAARRWLRLAGEAAPPPAVPAAPLLRPLPRPRGLGVPDQPGSRLSVLPPPRPGVAFKAGLARSAGRLAVWLYGGLRFSLGVLWDWLRRRNTRESQARRLRETFEKMGTTFIKFGQQLSMRADLLPAAYTHELEKLLDSVENAFPAAQAVRAIERATGQRLGEIFSAFDPEPIGKASVACVYRAVLRSGESVAVKVRRPGIVPRLAADMRALGWLLSLVEMLLFPAGFTENLVFELRTMLMEELDFTREARFADLYRRRMRKTRQLHFVSVPRVYFQHSSQEVMVADFVTGVWLKEIMEALETKDRRALDRLEEMRIDPVILARRIQLVARFNNFENIFFHADLHPANILVQPGNRILLIDFGSCGSFNRKELNSFRRWFDAQSVDDVGGMVQAALAIAEPLPPIDVDSFAMKLEAMFWNDLYAIKSKHSQWDERTSARLWMGFLKLSREFHVPLRLNMLRMIRASMLSDTIAARLDHDQDPYREFRHYEKGAGKRAKKRAGKRLHRLLGPSKYVRLEQGIESLLKLVYQVQRTVESLTSIRIGAFITKAVYAVLLLVRTLITTIASAFVITGFLDLFKGRLGICDEGFFTIMWRHVLTNQVFLFVNLAPILLIAIRRLLLRLNEKEPDW
ncbi:MAG TPA: AarF/UbiB family protein [Thermoanaerobaculia bacterium]|nr:AarF/UbiB family protein [Thermoanaerobaculia bacterium]